MLKSNNFAKLQPMYPLLIQQFVDDYNLSEGIAVDIGVGPGFLGLEMAKITNMKIVFIDISQEALDQAKNTFNSLDLDNEAEFINADVQALPLEDNYANFIMSRGSIWFWKEPEKGLREIHRILKPGGVAVVGGGLGRYLPETMRNRLQAALKQGLKERKEKRPSLEEFEAMVQKSGLSDYRIMTDGDTSSGKWVEIRK
ncbi:class I SAM-dependent methyltransferase [Petroclostridium sp. X23]|uniref:class I SAM-dependent methyltransferase n=1 Tax=Petroclostridium sp. X23 TaxID=3045146 RepID=UPI0024ADED3D|nr:class I SAM-dependent methyltransferase [Petroclostridium sp. X23]WHH58679.1 class I SAM-dependent methyltransferase [Petroclostridium sp. X23]